MKDATRGDCCLNECYVGHESLAAKRKDSYKELPCPCGSSCGLRFCIEMGTVFSSCIGECKIDCHSKHRTFEFELDSVLHKCIYSYFHLHQPNVSRNINGIVSSPS